MPNSVRESVASGQIVLPAFGCVRPGETASMAWAVVDASGREIEPISAFLVDLSLSDISPLTLRSYGFDLLRWWRLLSLVRIEWDRASRAEAELLVGWMRHAPNDQRRRSSATAVSSGSVNLRTGKPTLRPGYAPSTINHALTVVSAFYAFHGHFGRGPLLNPVPANARRRLLSSRGASETPAEYQRGPLRQRLADRRPRPIPDRLWNEMLAAMGCHRDRALLAFYVSSAARASELLGLCGEHVDWAGQRIWVVSKGSRLLEQVPGSPDAFEYLACYFEEAGTPGIGEAVWRTRRGEQRPLTYAAMRRILQRANDRLGTNWTLHDLRHTGASRMVNDSTLTLVEVQSVLRHRRVASTQLYLHPDVEQLHDKLQEHFLRPRPQPTFSPGYDAADFQTVFGG